MINKAPDQFPLEKTEQQWKEQLTPQEYFVIREKGTERPYTGEYNMHFEEGTYVVGRATPHCSPLTQNSTLTADGHPSTRASPTAPSWKSWTNRTE